MPLAGAYRTGGNPGLARRGAGLADGRNLVIIAFLAAFWHYHLRRRNFSRGVSLITASSRARKAPRRLRERR
jgi:hypothetical protein